MNIQLNRTHPNPWAIDGELKIAGQKICDTSENLQSHLTPGTYPITIYTCPHYRRKMPVILLDAETLKPSETPPCARCKRNKIGSQHANLPQFCPQIKIGNGVANRTDGSIIIGILRLPGFMLQSAEHFDRLIDRLDKAQQRGDEIKLIIQEAPKVQKTTAMLNLKPSKK